MSGQEEVLWGENIGLWTSAYSNTCWVEIWGKEAKKGGINIMFGRGKRGTKELSERDREWEGERERKAKKAECELKMGWFEGKFLLDWICLYNKLKAHEEWERKGRANDNTITIQFHILWGKRGLERVGPLSFWVWRVLRLYVIRTILDTQYSIVDNIVLHLCFNGGRKGFVHFQLQLWSQF